MKLLVSSKKNKIQNYSPKFKQFKHFKELRVIFQSANSSSFYKAKGYLVMSAVSKFAV